MNERRLQRINQKRLFKGSDSLYRYWDATAIVEFGLRMTLQAFEKDLREETEFLAIFDRVYKSIDREFDVPENVFDFRKNM